MIIAFSSVDDGMIVLVSPLSVVVTVSKDSSFQNGAIIKAALTATTEMITTTIISPMITPDRFFVGSLTISYFSPYLFTFTIFLFSEIFLQPRKIRKAPVSRSIDTRIIAGVILGAPIIPATNKPPTIKAPIRNIGIPKTKLITAMTFPTYYSSPSFFASLQSQTNKSNWLVNFVCDSEELNLRKFRYAMSLLDFSCESTN